MAFTLMGAGFAIVSAGVRIGDIAGRCIEDAADEIEAVAGAEHRRRRLLPRVASGAVVGERRLGIRADPPPPGEAQGRVQRPALGAPRAPAPCPPRSMPAALQRLRHPPRRHSRAAAARPSRAARRRDRRHSRAARTARPAPRPAARPAPPQPRSLQLAAKVVGELRAGRPIASGIEEAEPLEPVRVERRPLSPSAGWFRFSFTRHDCATVSPDYKRGRLPKRGNSAARTTTWMQ